MSHDSEIVREIMREMGRKGGLASRAGRMAKITPEQRREYARRGGLEKARRWRERRDAAAANINNPSH